MAVVHNPSSHLFYHGTKADLKPGDPIEPGYISNFGKRKKAAYVYLTATLDSATWGAELAVGEGPGRIYVVVPTGPIEDDPNLTGSTQAAWYRGDRGLSRGTTMSPPANQYGVPKVG